MNKGELRKILKENNVKQWEVADVLGLRENQFSTRLRYPISAEFEAEIKEAIESIKENE